MSRCTRQLGRGCDDQGRGGGSRGGIICVIHVVSLGFSGDVVVVSEGGAAGGASLVLVSVVVFISSDTVGLVLHRDARYGSLRRDRCGTSSGGTPSCTTAQKCIRFLSPLPPQ